MVSFILKLMPSLSLFSPAHTSSLSHTHISFLPLFTSQERQRSSLHESLIGTSYISMEDTLAPPQSQSPPPPSVGTASSLTISAPQKDPNKVINSMDIFFLVTFILMQVGAIIGLALNSTSSQMAQRYYWLGIILVGYNRDVEIRDLSVPVSLSLFFSDTHTPTHSHTLILTYMHKYTCIYTYIHVYTYILTYTCTYTLNHTHTHTLSLSLSLSLIHLYNIFCFTFSFSLLP